MKQEFRNGLEERLALGLRGKALPHLRAEAGDDLREEHVDLRCDGNSWLKILVG
ncbi:MAG: hypothetical protein R3B97_18070 [Dehalococcoidia bacterium]